MRKRECKLAAKKFSIVETYLQGDLKPLQISKKLRVPVELVYKTVERFKNEVKKKESTGGVPAKVGRKQIRDDPMLLEEI